jgi:hypothetical protein
MCACVCVENMNCAFTPSRLRTHLRTALTTLTLVTLVTKSGHLRVILCSCVRAHSHDTWDAASLPLVRLLALCSYYARLKRCERNALVYSMH